MMSFDIAKRILEKEFTEFDPKPNERLAIELFGGEPLLNFPLIQQVYNWVKSKKPNFAYIFQVTTNGTLLTDKIKQWFIEHKDDFRIVMSVDGTEAMHALNRGCQLEALTIAFVKSVWPDSYFKLTISPDSLSYYADGVIFLSEQGFRIASSLAEGQIWEKGASTIYQKELEKIGEYFLSHPEKQLEHPFNFLFKEYLDERLDKLPKKNCGVGTTIGMYDVDGSQYPCHLFLPMVHGDEQVCDKVKTIDFTKTELLIDESCLSCKALKICKTCYGYNFIQRGNVTRRDKTMCRLRLAEAQYISSFQIRYLMTKSKQINLDNYELLMLKAALRCFQEIKDVIL